ncbi:MAG: RluA family pseudouridine synthase [Syntrophotaleaceae bacterium]
MSRKTYRLKVVDPVGDLRLDQFIANEIGELSRAMARKVIDFGGVHVDGRRVGRCSFPVKAGQQIEVYLDGMPLIVAELGPGDILFRDPYLLAINKTAGIDFQPTHARYKGTVYETILRYLGSGSGRKAPQVGMVQRLDRDTSGVALFSVHPAAHRGLTKLFSEHKVRKKYLALIGGRLPDREGTFRSLLARQHRTNLMKSVDRGGKEGITSYRVREELEGASLVEVEIPTGRSHQIRVHFSEAGCPLLGDTRYGGVDRVAETVIPRHMLHALSLELVHPVTRENLALTAPLPADMLKVIRELQKESG